MLGKVFTQHTHIVAIKTSGNVYAYEVCVDWEGGLAVTEAVQVWRLWAQRAPGYGRTGFFPTYPFPRVSTLYPLPIFCAQQAVQELNLKAKNMRDLLTDEAFTRKDVIHIQARVACAG